MCSECQLWSHASCNSAGESEYKKPVDEDDVPWYCITNVVSQKIQEFFPFGFLSETELCDLMGATYHHSLTCCHPLKLAPS